MCQQTWFLSPFIFFYNNHYELGSCLILEKPKLSSQVKATPKLQISKRFRHYRTTIQALVFSLIFICFAISLILYILTYDFAHGGFPHQDHCSVKVIQNSNATYEFQYQYKGAMSTSTDYKTAYYLVQSETGCTSYSSSSTPKFLATMFCLVGIFFLAVFTNTFKPATHRGLLRYLRQLGTPMVEEVMISYAWQAGHSEDVRCIGKALLKSGIGVWIDILKLTTGDKTSKTTRTVAAHARFVLIMLTTRYINSPACFVEIYEALRTPGASNRVIIYVVDETAYSKPDELCAVDLEKVKQLATQLESKGLKVLWKLTDLIDYLNKNVVYSVDRTHLLWWQRYVSAGAGVPDKAIPPDTKASNALKKCNLKLFTLPSFKSQGNRDSYRNEIPLRFTRHGVSLISRIRIANVWISGDLRELGQNASAFPWLFLFFSICLTLPVVDLLTGNLVTDARGSMFPLSIIFLAYSFGVVSGVSFIQTKRSSPQLLHL
ncbi:hypothetical protein BCR33DRAFT_454547 [Rhizoclosmatium globosum]|uniref:TIR domain-containing protein n=1 Tax=Rhizoclosmatium globosum TaxID=329046 RepID=A0A1Y2CWM4_9FUNG|nr:hypothetical protein BCR33DRAFT_454547 [Rhizoclosmatium globosum]|eukprot:ORY51428.1 hypothetical protein BCR33DRAFT_454547 [Rhizoclosmatium globosum]